MQKSQLKKGKSFANRKAPAIGKNPITRGLIFKEVERSIMPFEGENLRESHHF